MIPQCHAQTKSNSIYTNILQPNLPPSPPLPKPKHPPNPKPPSPTPLPPRLLLNPQSQKLPIPQLPHILHPRPQLRLSPPTKRHQRRHTRNQIPLRHVPNCRSIIFNLSVGDTALGFAYAVEGEEVMEEGGDGGGGVGGGEEG